MAGILISLFILLLGSVLFLVYNKYFFTLTGFNFNSSNLTNSSILINNSNFKSFNLFKSLFGSSNKTLAINENSIPQTKKFVTTNILNTNIEISNVIKILIDPNKISNEKNKNKVYQLIK